MAQKQGHWSSNSMSLFAETGERKYLTHNESKRFLNALDVLSDEKDRSFVETLFWTGCRPSEALGFRAIQVDLDENMLIFRSAKKRGEWKRRKFRPVPVPPPFIKRLDDVHDLRQARAREDQGANVKLWTFCRTTGWDRVRIVMDAAEITGMKACGRGLRHAFGVRAAVNNVGETRIQSWLGHEDLATTAIYMNVAGMPEDHFMAQRMWKGLAA